MQIKLFVILVTYWSNPGTNTDAFSGFSAKTQLTVTHFNETYSDLTLNHGNFTAWSHYTDQQLGIFRLTLNTRQDWKRFTLAPLNLRMSVLTVHSVGFPLDCIAALIVPDPWNSPRVLMTTVQFYGNQKHFEGFNNDWVSVVVTNSTDGRIHFFLCSEPTSIPLTLEPLVGGTTMNPYKEYKPFRDTDEWCADVANEISNFTEEIETFINQQEEARITSMFIAYWLLGAIIMAALLFGLVMKFVL